MVPLRVDAARRQLVRERLLGMLDAGLAHPLTLVSAPAGFGKTEAVRSWLAQRAIDARWVSLGSGVVVAREFWERLADALEARRPGRGARIRGLLVAPELPPPEAIVAVVLGDLAVHTGDPASCVLVIDDLHTVSDPQIFAALRLLLERLPPWLHLVLITRHDPPLPLARLRAYGRLGELRAADLRFTRDETAALLARAGRPDLSPDTLAALHARTEGWVVALQLAALAMVPHPDPGAADTAMFGSNRQIISYLVEEVLATLPAATQTFLLRTVLLERLCGPLCTAVLGPEAADLPLPPEELLPELERRNLFLAPIDHTGRWYRYDRLFAEMLRHELERREPALPPILHRRAAAWWEAAGDLDAAFAHLQSAGDADASAAFVERHGRSLISRSRTVQLRRWLDRLAPEEIARRPLLTIWAAWLPMLSGRVAGAIALLEPLSAQETPTDPYVRGELAALQCSLARYRGNLGEVRRLSAVAQAALPHDRGVEVTAALNEGLALLGAADEQSALPHLEAAVHAAGRDAGAYGGLMALHALARIALRKGQPGPALALCAQAEQRAQVWAAETLPALGAVLVCAAEAQAAVGALDAARATLDRAEALLAGTIELNPAVRGAALRAWLEPGRLGLAARLAPIDRVLAWLDLLSAAAPQSRAWLAAQRARIALAHQAHAAAEAWVQADPLAPDPETALLQRLVRAQVGLAAGGDPAPIAAELAAVSATLARHGWVLLQIEALALEAAALQALGRTAAATAALERACTLAAPARLIGPLVAATHGVDLHTLLAALRPAWAERPGYVDRLELVQQLAAQIGVPAAPPQAPATPPVALAEPLSPREHEILHLIAAGLSNQAIADKLIVALNTVKWYTSEIYAKLGVRSRTQALIRARELGLIV